MATSTTVTSGYAGALAGELFVQAFKASDTIGKGAITILPNIIGSGFLPKLSYSAALQVGAGCGFDPSGTITYADKEVALSKYKIDEQICKDDFAQTFQAQQAGLFSAHAEVPATILDGILEAMLNNMGQAIDNEIWQGDGTTASFNGLLAQWAADGDVVDVVGTASTSANVQAELAKVYDAIPDSVINDPMLVMVASSNVAKNYKQSQIGNYLVGTPVGDKELDYLGVPIISIGGLPANTIAAYRLKNVAFLTGLEADYNEVKVQELLDLSGNINTQIKFTAAVGYSFGAEIVYYATA
jgi:hypothetical protein